MQTFPSFRHFPAILTGTLVLMIASGAGALPALREVKDIRDPLIITAVAWEISEKCDDISARKIRGLQYLYGIRSAALALGYTSDEIEIYIKDKAEKKIIEDLARQQIRVMTRDVEIAEGEDALCALGQDQIGKGTLIGRLLR